MKTWYIYAHYTKDTNECFYIGVGTDNRINDRFARNDYWKRIVNKHGYRIEIIKDNFINRDEAVNKEIMLQLFFKPKACFHYGDGHSYMTSEETKNKISNTLTGRTLSKEHIVAMSKPRSSQAKHNISEAQKGKTLSKEHKIKLSKIGKKPKSPEHMAKMSKTIKNCKEQTFSSIAAAAKKFCISTKSISNNLHKRSKSAGKYKDGTKIKWKF